MHAIFVIPIYYLLNKSYLCIFNIILRHSELREDIIYSGTRITLDYASDFCSLLSFLVYLEIIELHFCKLAHDLKRKILHRSSIKVTKTSLN